MSFNKKLIIGTIAGIVIFLAVILIYFRYGLSGDKVLYQGDIMNHKGMSKEIVDYREKGEEVLWTNSMFGGMPAYQISVLYANQSLKFIHKAFQLFLPHPIGLVFLYFIGFFILMLCMKINPWMGVVCSVAFAFSSYFFIIIEAGHNSKAVAIGYSPALLGGIILLLRQKWLLGFVVTALFFALEIWANHPQITYYFFLLYGFVILGKAFEFFREKQLKAFFKAIALMILAMGIGIAPNIANLWTTAEYTKYTTRGPSELTINADGGKNDDKKGLPIEYATDWSYGKGESFTLLVPNYKGGASGVISENVDEKILDKVDANYTEYVSQSNIYWGDQPFTSGPVYAGAIVVLLSLIALFVVKDRMKWFLFAGALLTLALSWGKNFPALTQFFFDYVPYYNKFRAVSMILVVVEMVLPLLAALFLNEIVTADRAALKQKIAGKMNAVKKGIIISSSIVLLFLLGASAAPRMFNTFHSQQEDPSYYEKERKKELLEKAKQENPGMNETQLMQQVEPVLDQYMDGYKNFLKELENVRISYFRQDVLRSLFFVLLAAALLLFYISSNGFSKELFYVAMGLLILTDMWMVNSRYLNKDSYREKSDEEFVATPADEYILKDNSAIDFRVVSTAVNTFNNSTVSYFHKSVGGYHGAKLKRFQELREFHLDKELFYAGKIADDNYPDSIAIPYLTRYTPVLNMLNTRYFITQKNAGGKPYQNPAANGNAWFVSQVRWAPNADSEVVWTGNINTKTTAVINEKFKDQLQGWDKIAGSWATIKLDGYEPNYLKYSFDSKSKQLIVFSEIWYPAGWNAYIDGKLTPHVCANYILRAMMVPEGKHTIEFKFEPKSYYTGQKISTAGLILYYLVVFGGLGWYVYTRWKKNQNPLKA